MSLAAGLNNCESEPIHIPGKIQSHGVLIAFDKDDQIIKYYSKNIFESFSIDENVKLFNQKFLSFFSNLGFAQSETEVWDFIENFIKNPVGLGGLLLRSKSGDEYFLVPHLSDKNIIVEFEKKDKSSFRSSDEMMLTDIPKIISAPNLKESLQLICESVRELIQYDRVMIYKFEEDQHGVVVSECTAEGVESFLDHHFPASDIPPQARELYRKNLVRIIADVHSPNVEIISNTDIPLDLSASILRAVSPVHIEYLKNMDVMSSFSISILKDEKLWGMIACHHSKPLMIDYKTRKNCVIFGQLLSSTLSFREVEINLDEKFKYNEQLSTILHNLFRTGDISSSLLKQSPNILDINEASGAALVLGNSIQTIGLTPEPNQIQNIVDWIINNKKENFFATNNFSTFNPDAKEYTDFASGIMCTIIMRNPVQMAIWFKPEIETTIKWAGDPNKKKMDIFQGHQRLSPRKSFQSFIEEMKGHSEPWSNTEKLIAKNAGRQIVFHLSERSNEIFQLNQKLRDAYNNLETFSYTVSHNLKTPISTIKNYAQLMMEIDPTLSDQSRSFSEKIIDSTDRLNELINNILHYSKIGIVEINDESIDMLQTIEQIKEELETEFRIVKPTIVVQNLVPLKGDPTMIYQVFSNLIGNAVKYSSNAENSKVTIDSYSNDDYVEYVISDNGVGIDQIHGDSIFEMFKRVGDQKKFKGTGIGLAIVKRILEKHKASIRYESEKDKGTSFYIMFKRWYNTEK